MAEETYYGILNVERNRMLTSASGRSIWRDEYTARRIMNDEFGGGSHLEVVKVIRTED